MKNQQNKANWLIGESIQLCDRWQSNFVVFGPEGGLMAEEINQFVDAGAIICGLGPRILRTETAPLYLLSAASYHWELNK